MRLKWWFKVNQNKLYKKYNFDPHGYLLRKAQITKTFKFLLNNFKYSVLKKLYVKKVQINKFRQRFFKAFKRRSWKYKHFFRRKSKKKIKKKKRIVVKRILKNWNYNFWNKFETNYFNRAFKNLKQNKYSSFFFLRAFKRSIDNRFSRGYRIKNRLRWINRNRKKHKRNKKKVSVRNSAKRKRRKLMKQITWLNVIKYRKKQKAWWLMRVTNKKAAFFYGVIQLKKFRYINKLNNRNIPLSYYYSNKLQCMLNIVLFRLNFFDNIFIANNFIRIAGIVLVNNKKVLYPFRFIKINDVISFHPAHFKKMFNIFYKRSKFNKSFIIKKMKKKPYRSKPSSFKLLKAVKNFVNVPSYIEYNYKIMHFILWRQPYENDFLSLGFKYYNTHLWSFETQLQYN